MESRQVIAVGQSCILSQGPSRSPSRCVFLFSLLPVVLLAMVCCATAAPNPAGVTQDSTEVMLDRLESLCSEGRFVEALPAARHMQQLISQAQEDRTHLQPWNLLRIHQLIAKIERAVVLPSEAQQELAEAERLASEAVDCFSQGRRECGEERSARMLGTSRRYFGDQSLETGLRLRDLAHGREKAGDYIQAEVALRESLKVYRELLGREDAIVARILMELSGLLEARGQYDEAEQACREALALHVKHYGEGFIWSTDDLMQLGSIYYAEGRLDEAESLMQRSLALRRRLVRQEGRVEESLHNLSLVLISRGDYARAESILWDLLKIRRARFRHGHPSIPANLNLLCRVMLAKGEVDSAEVLAREAVAERRRVHGNVHPDLAKDLSVLASIRARRHAPQEAEKLFREALDIARQSLGPENPVVSTSMMPLAELLNREGRTKEAEGLLRQAIRMLRTCGDKEAMPLAVALQHLASSLLARGRLTEAESCLAEAATFFEQARVRRGTGMSRVSVSASPYRALALVRLMLKKNDEAWSAAERELARSLADLLLATRQRYLTGSERAQQDSLQRRLIQLEGQIDALQQGTQRTPGDMVTAALETTRDSLLAAEVAWSNFQKEIAFRHPITEGVAFGLERVQATLRPDVALIGWVEGESKPGERLAWGYVIRDSGPVRWTPLKPTAKGDDGDVRSAASRLFRERLAMAGSWPVRVTEFGEITRAARELYQEWIAPLTSYLDGVQHLVVLPSGSMLGVPVEAFVTPEGTCLGETWAVGYAPSATLYTWLWEEGSGRRAPMARKALILADPDFGVSRLDAAESVNVVTQVVGQGVWAGVHTGAFRGDRVSSTAAFPRLPATRQEALKLAALMPDATVLLGPEASEQTLVRMSESGVLGKFDTIHLATHALVDDEHPEISALVLSQVDLPDPLRAAMAGDRIYDGLLQVREIAREWHLDADLVTLSACRTAMGKAAGGEGYLGLTQTLLQVGARTLLVSLWKVEDEATSLLMTRFYENLTGHRPEEPGVPALELMSKSEALREAKHWLRTYTDSSGRQPFQHPAYWSAFVLIGEP